jgi:hypothetical protein
MGHRHPLSTEQQVFRISHTRHRERVYRVRWTGTSAGDHVYFASMEKARPYPLLDVDDVLNPLGPSLVLGTHEGPRVRARTHASIRLQAMEHSIQ